MNTCTEVVKSTLAEKIIFVEKHDSNKYNIGAMLLKWQVTNFKFWC